MNRYKVYNRAGGLLTIEYAGSAASAVEICFLRGYCAHHAIED